MKETKTTMKLTPAQAYAAQVKADRRAAALERRATGAVVERQIDAMYGVRRAAQPVKVVKGTKKIRWSDAEYDLLIDLYLKHVDCANGVENGALITEQFLAEYPARGAAAVNFGIAQIKALDSYYPAKGLKDTSQALIDKLYAVAPERFPGGATLEEKVSNAIDALLAEIRA